MRELPWEEHILLRFATLFVSHGIFTPIRICIWQGDEIDYRGVLHRDGSVLMSVSLDQLKVMTSLQVCSTCNQTASYLNLVFDTLHIGWSGVVGDWFMIDENECACIKGRKFPQYLVKCLLIWLQAPETLYRALATKLIIGMPYKVFPFVLYDFTIFLWLVISSSMSIWLLVVCCL